MAGAVLVWYNAGGSSMENAGIISIMTWDFDTDEAYKDYDKWSKNSLALMLMSSIYRLGMDRWVRLEDRAAYRNWVSASYYSDFEGFIVDSHGLQRTAFSQDVHSTWKDKYENSWRSVYFLVRRLKGPSVTEIDKGKIIDKTTHFREFLEEDAPVVLLKGLVLSPEQWERYDDWVNEWGYDIYIPLLLKIPGISEYSRWWLSNIRRDGRPPQPEITDTSGFPQDLSIIIFDNLKAYQNFCQSKELAAFNKTLSTAFPEGLNYTRDQAYLLLRRWSK
jgi:hypothetical protein